MSTEDFKALLAHERTRHDEQRKQLATAMHNDVSQGLTVLTMELALLQQRLDDVEEAKISELLEVVAGVNQAVRRISGELHPRILDEFGLIAALQSECRHLLSGMGVTVKLAHDIPDVPLPSKVAIQVFRLFQEIIAIMVNCSGSKEIAVALSLSDAVLRISFVQSRTEMPVKPFKEKLGADFRGVRERAYWIGGELNVEANHTGGMTATFIVPVRQGQVTP